MIGVLHIPMDSTVLWQTPQLMSARYFTHRLIPFCIATTFAACVPVFVQAQFGPNLSVGVGKVAYDKGQLDSELILQIIATKQAEIKSELAKRLILQQFECGSFTLYNYARKNVDMLLSNTGTDVVKKEMLRNSAELLLVYGLAEFYMANFISDIKNGQFDPKCSGFYNQMTYWTGPSNKQLLANQGIFPKDFKPSDDVRALQSADLVLTYSGLQQAAGPRVTDGAYLPKVEYLPLFNNSNKLFSEKKAWFRSECGNIAPIHIFLDLVYEVCRNNKAVQQAGFFKNEGVTEDEYRLRSKYLRFEEVSPNMHADFEEAKIKITKIVEGLFKYFYILNELKSNGYGDLNIPNLQEFESKLLAAASVTTGNLKDKNIKDLFSSISTALKSSPQLDGLLPVALTDQERKVIARVQELLGYALQADGSRQLDDLCYALDHEILPHVLTMNVKNKNAYQSLYESLENLSLWLKLDIISELSKEEEFIGLLKSLDYYVELIGLLSNLDRAESYDKVIKFLTEIGESFGNPASRRIMTFLAEGYDKYSSVDQDNNLINFNVESMAEDLYARYGANSSTRLSFYLSVGANNAIHPGASDYKINDALVLDATQFSFISEKIGFKYKWVDFNRRRMYKTNIKGIPHYNDPNEDRRLGSDAFKTKYKQHRNVDRPALISDIHTVLYGSGLLYQISALSTEDSFSSPVIGISPGITFFNNLDFNVGWAVPLISDARPFVYPLEIFEYGFINVGFDIRFVDYLGALRQKNATRKN